MAKEIAFESAQGAAEHLGVTSRTVQKWAASGKIVGAKKVGRTWFIPKDAVILDTAQVNHLKENSNSNGIPDVYQLSPFRMAMPLLNSSYPIGKCMEYINSIPDKDDRKIALGEYYHFSGQSEKAAETVEEYLDSHDPALRYSAALICSFANLSRGHIHLARFAMNTLMTQVYVGLNSNAPPKFQAMGIFTATAASVLLHLPVPEIPPLENYLRYLPDGLKLWGCYVLAHKAYLEKDYTRSLAIADMGITLCAEQHPIALVYNHIVAVMALMNLKRTDEAKKRMAEAWAIAQPDDIIEPFGEHHGLLHGMIEVFFKKDYPKDFERIINITYSFSAGWRKIHNPDTKEEVADNLTTTEFTVAMLYSRGWAVKEIAAHIELSARTVTNYISNIYSKLGINDRNELGQYMLR